MGKEPKEPASLPASASHQAAAESDGVGEMPLFEPKGDLASEPSDGITKQWKRFEEATEIQEMVEIFHSCLEDEELMDDEQAFWMLEGLSTTMTTRGYEATRRYREWGALFQALEEKRPDLFASSEGFYRSAHLSHALLAGADEELRELAIPFARNAGNYPDEFGMQLDALRYRGDSALLLEIAALVRESYEARGAGLLEWAIFEAKKSALWCVIYHAIETSDEPLSQIQEYFDANASALEEDFALDLVLSEGVLYLMGQADHPWKLEELQLKRRPKFDSWEEEEEAPVDPARKELVLLSHEFLGVLWREEGVPLNKGELARESIVRYLNKRANDELKIRKNLFGTPRKGKKSRAPDKRSLHPLCPDAVTLERFLLTDYAQIYDDRGPWRAFACFEYLPSWLGFLESRGLLHGHERTKSIGSWAPLAKGFASFAKERQDPLLLQAAEGFLSRAP